MSEHGIIFTGDSVRAILRGDKTQTRRVINPQPTYELQSDSTPDCGHREWMWRECRLHSWQCPYGKPGDLLWVKETWWQEYQIGFDEATNECGKPLHIAHYEPPKALDYGRTVVKRSPLYMPRWASRITLRLTDVRVQRIQDITEEDAIAEGVVYTGPYPMAVAAGFIPIPADLARKEYKDLWNSINARRGHPWEKNDWVWALTFERSET